MKILIWLNVFVIIVTGMLTSKADPILYKEFYQHKIRSRSAKPQPMYLLVTTSTKIYSVEIPANFDYTKVDQQRTESNVIYSESELSHNWITDAFYVKSEDLIYVNVYNSTLSASDIFTLKYNEEKGKYEKTVLYTDQSFCLGIAYNEDRKELYWTAAKKILAGSSKPNGEQKVIFELNSAKKLLYLKYDSVADVLYVSTLNNVYECLLGDQDFTQSILYTERCRIISRNLVSARGLYLDAENRNLYVVDHKKREVKKIELKNAIVKKNVNSHIDQAESHVKADSVSRVSESRSSLKSSSVFLNQQILPTLGDVFYMCIYNRSSADLVIWSEFSGKIKLTKMNDMSKYKVLLNTEEYTYSISIMDNRTDSNNIEIPAATESITTDAISTTADFKPTTMKSTSKDVEADTTMPKTEKALDTKKYSLIENETQQLYEYGSRKFIISNSNPEPSEDSSSRLKSYFLRSSSHISAALYIVICLLCFSLFINIILLYISKMKHIKSKKILLSHEICDLTSAQSNRSGSNKSASEASTTDCNLNLINNSSGGSATSGLDSEI